MLYEFAGGLRHTILRGVKWRRGEYAFRPLVRGLQQLAVPHPLFSKENLDLPRGPYIVCEQCGTYRLISKEQWDADPKPFDAMLEFIDSHRKFLQELKTGFTLLLPQEEARHSFPSPQES